MKILSVCILLAMTLTVWAQPNQKIEVSALDYMATTLNANFSTNPMLIKEYGVGVHFSSESQSGGQKIILTCGYFNKAQKKQCEQILQTSQLMFEDYMSRYKLGDSITMEKKISAVKEQKGYFRKKFKKYFNK